MKTWTGGEQGFDGEHTPMAEGGGMPAINSLGAAAVLPELYAAGPDHATYRARAITGTVDIDYLHKTGLVRRPGDGSISA